MRTRFAPSPTGFLHVGGLRTALYSYLVAKQNKGKFLLRIEDTDQERSVPGAIENIVNTLHWAGIHPEEGVMVKNGVVVQEGSHGPYIQSERLELYRKYGEELLKSGNAYHCFCSPERLERMRNDQQARKVAPMYDRHCLSLTPEQVKEKIANGERPVLRMKIPRDEAVALDDEIRGTVVFQGITIDDQVLLKSDGFPTYHLANVVDDHLMDIDMVLRGEEWLSSTPKHLLLFRYLGWKHPRYAHVPLLLNKDRTKLSKRQNDVAAEHYREKGYLPEALVNFLALLGWNPGTTQEIFSLDELIEQFSLERVQKAGAVFDLTKLDWVQGQWMRKIPLAEFAERIRPLVAVKFSQASNDRDFETKAALVQERITFFNEAPEMLSFFYDKPKPTPVLLANEKQKVKQEDLPEILDTVIALCEGVPEKEWKKETLLETVKAKVGEGTWKLGQLLWPMRAALTGLPYSPGAVEVAEALGREESLERLATARSILG
ncbi:MAG: glutamate--tRNA ligase [Candidatus Peregrinibacteria bacterium]|nr:glutamate--tRNA ligase [Candidatus Peregrinibacteria bacterium]